MDSVNVKITFLCVQEDLEQQELFNTQLEAVEKQTQSIRNKLKANMNDKDPVKVGQNPWTLRLCFMHIIPPALRFTVTSLIIFHCGKPAVSVHMLTLQIRNF